MNTLSIFLPGAIFISATAIACIAAPPAPTPTQVPPTTTTNPASDTRWRSTLEKLSSPTFATREQGQKDLDSATWRDLQTLRDLAAASADVEVRARLQLRIDQLEEYIALHPTPISLNVQNANIAGLAEALSKALDVPPIPGISSNPDDPQSQPRYTLAVREKSLWEILEALNQQHPVSLEYTGDCANELALIEGISHTRFPADSGQIAAFPQSLLYQRETRPQEAPGKQVQPERLHLGYQLLADPRLKIVGESDPTLTEVLDDNKNNLLAKSNAPNTIRQQNSVVMPAGADLLVPNHIGKKIVSAKGSVALNIVTREDRLVLDDLEKNLQKQFIVGQKKFKIESFQPMNNNWTELVVTLESAKTEDKLTKESPPTMVITDADNKMVWKDSLREGIQNPRIGGPYKSPLHVLVTIAVKMDRIDIPFEMRDLPLP